VGIIEDLISFDSTTIQITRHVKVPNAGGYTFVDVVLDPIDVRLYNYEIRHQREVTLETGEVKIVAYGVLAPATADIIVGHDSHDTFTAEGRTFRIVGLRHYDDVNAPEHYQADCVAV
jgi:hypothetical protein